MYKLPDPQPHIARLPAGVQIPKKVMQPVKLIIDLQNHIIKLTTYY